MFIQPTVTEFKEHFYRDFPYAADVSDLTKVTVTDINKAFKEAKFNFNEALVSEQCEYTLLFLYLSAHYLVVDLRNSAQGLNGKYSWLEGSKSVGSVSQSFAIPAMITDDPYLAMLTQTNYGAKYLQLIIPQLRGQMFFVCGSTRP